MDDELADRRKHIPASLQSLDWQQWSDEPPMKDGESLLVAVAVVDDDSCSDRWHYEFDVVSVNWDGEYFVFPAYLNPLDVEFFVRIK